MAAGKYPSHTAILSSMGIAGVCQHVSQFSGYLPEPGAIRVMTPAAWKVLVALQPCLRGGFTGSQWSSKSRVGTGTDECALGGCDQQRVLAKSWCINFMFCWAVAGRGLLLRCWWGTLTTSVFFWWERLEVIFNVTVCCDRTDTTWGSSLH